MTRSIFGESAPPVTDPAEGYPTLVEVLRAINDDYAIPDKGVRRIEINAFASGEVTYTVTTVDLDEPLGGHLTGLTGSQ